jgi:lysyl-tRNA synthetase, class II
MNLHRLAKRRDRVSFAASSALPRVAALVAALVGAVNVASTLTPNIRWRGHLLLEYEPVQAMRLFHALALPAGAALLLVAPYLAKRRRRAFDVAIALMVALGAFDLLKGLDFEETAITWGAAAILMLGSGAFRVRHDPIRPGSRVWRVPLASLVGLGVAALSIWAAQGHPSWQAIVQETATC